MARQKIWDSIQDVLGVPSSFEEFALADNKGETSEQSVIMTLLPMY